MGTVAARLDECPVCNGTGCVSLPQPETAALGDVLRARRHRARLTLKAVGARSGVSLGYLSQIEKGRNAPSLETLRKVAGALGCRASDLLREAEGDG